MRKYGFIHGRGHGHETGITINTDDFTVNAAYISIVVNSVASSYDRDTVMRPYFCTMTASLIKTKPTKPSNDIIKQSSFHRNIYLHHIIAARKIHKYNKLPMSTNTLQIISFLLLVSIKF